MSSANVVSLHDDSIRGSRGSGIGIGIGAMRGRGWLGRARADRRCASVHVRVRNSCTIGICARLELSIPEASPRLVAGFCDDPIVCAKEPDLRQIFPIGVLATEHDCVRCYGPWPTYQGFCVRDGGSTASRTGKRGNGAGIPRW
jgi:hypothetical protein